jgi:3-hydroxy-D-aspartate aldolase
VAERQDGGSILCEPCGSSPFSTSLVRAIVSPKAFLLKLQRVVIVLSSVAECWSGYNEQGSCAMVLNLEIGYDVPARPGMTLDQVQTPALVLDLDALDDNLRRMGRYVKHHGVALRAHGKMHKSADIARRQMEIGGACGICCQKVSEAEAFVKAGILDVLVSNQVRDAAKIDRLAQLPNYDAKVGVCIDDLENVIELAAAVARHGTVLDVLVELDCGAERCGVPPAAVPDLARAVCQTSGLRFAGIQAYQGAMQHLPTFAERQAKFACVADALRIALNGLKTAGITCETVTGAGTGSYPLETASGLYTELQCGSYAFMDADYGRVLNAEGDRLDDENWRNAMFILTQVMSTAGKNRAVCDAGLKALTGESGLPTVFENTELVCTDLSDEHCKINDLDGILTVGQRLFLVPGHCDPTVNLHDWYVGMRGGLVEAVWPVTARGKIW